MSARLIILLAVAGVLAVALALRPAKPPPPAFEGTIADDKNRDRKELDLLGTRLWLRELPGEEPPEPPILHIDVAVDTSSGKNRLVYNITEEHGYYVETLWVDFWYKDAEHPTKEESLLVVTHPIENYVKANETLTGCIELNPAELEDVGGDIGTTENWGARIYRKEGSRARAQNPDPLPPLGDAGACR